MSNEQIAQEAAKEIFPIGRPETNEAQRESAKIILLAIQRAETLWAWNKIPHIKGYCFPKDIHAVGTIGMVKVEQVPL